MLEEIFAKKSLIEATFSSPVRGKIKPVAIKNQRLYQLTTTETNKAFHRNMDAQEALDTILKELLPRAKEAVFYTEDCDLHLIQGKLHKKKATKQAEEIAHNRVKQSPLPLSPLPFLLELGVMKPTGQLKPDKADKFRQINRFLELVRDVLPNTQALQIVDFGCGKGYLTFALQYYLTEVLQREAQIIGIDLKRDVVSHLQQLASRLKTKNLHFETGDIRDYKPKGKVDMVIALHACNTATDYALAQAVEWKAEVILAAPCCHQELYPQIENSHLESLLQHGILREKFSALATDALRSDLLEMAGYKTQVIEFVDPEHTPKNLLIRAMKGNSEGRRAQAKTRYEECKAALHAEPTLQKLLNF